MALRPHCLIHTDSELSGRGQEIQEYFLRTVKKWDLTKHVLFEHRVQDARWIEDRAQWTLVVQNGGKTFEVSQSEGRKRSSLWDMRASPD